jgi:hypothetical protein
VATTNQVAAADAASSTAVCVFGVTWAAIAPDAGDVRGLEYREIAAVVAAAPAQPIRLRRRDLLRHRDVLQQAFGVGTVLPLRFGAVFATPAAVVDDLLAARYDELVRLLRQFDGLAELRVCAAYEEQAILAELVRSDARIARLREATRSGGRQAEPLRIELGEAVARALDARRGRDGDELVHTLCARARDAVIEERQSELEVFRGSFLVEQAEVGSFNGLLESVAGREQGRTAFTCTGPLPPYSFVALSTGHPG